MVERRSQSPAVDQVLEVLPTWPYRRRPSPSRWSYRLDVTIRPARGHPHPRHPADDGDRGSVGQLDRLERLPASSTPGDQTVSPIAAGSPPAASRDHGEATAAVLLPRRVVHRPVRRSPSVDRLHLVHASAHVGSRTTPPVFYSNFKMTLPLVSVIRPRLAKVLQVRRRFSCRLLDHRVATSFGTRWTPHRPGDRGFRVTCALQVAVDIPARCPGESGNLFKPAMRSMLAS